MINITNLASIATVVGICFTIWLFYYKKKKRVCVDLATEGRRSDDPKIYIMDGVWDGVWGQVFYRDKS